MTTRDRRARRLPRSKRQPAPEFLWWILLASSVVQIVHWGVSSTSGTLRWPFLALGVTMAAVCAWQLVVARRARR